MPDPRTHAWRADLAAEHLRETVRAPRYAAGRETQATGAVLALHARPDPESGRVSELLFGERFTVYDQSDGWAWGQGAADGYVGYVRTCHLSDSLTAHSHTVSALRSIMFSRPDLRSRPLMMLHLNSRVAVETVRGGYAKVAGGGWVPERHLAPAGDHARDHVAVARLFLGAPYLWGGRSSLGLDCSGLAQLALTRAGRPAPRDSDQQEAEVGVPVAGGVGAARTGDLLFTAGHVAMLSGAGRVLHANAHHMAVCEEPASVFLDRLRAAGLTLTSVRRPE